MTALTSFQDLSRPVAAVRASIRITGQRTPLTRIGGFFLPLLFLLLAAVLQPANAQDAKLREGDQLEIRIGGVPVEEITQVTGTYTVDGQGFVNMPHIGKVKASGATQSELQSAIENAYRNQKIYTNPSITVAVPNLARFVDVGGDVKNPMRVPFTADLTLLGAINGAGGFTDYADQGKVRLMRDGEVTIVNIKQVRKNPSKDVKLKPGDKIEVPQSFF